jgi:peptidoglycan hydrolase CwlO-like protein
MDLSAIGLGVSSKLNQDELDEILKNTYEDELKRLDNEREEDKQKITTLTNQLNELKKANNGSDAEIKALQKQIDALEDSVDDNDDLKDQLKSAYDLSKKQDTLVSELNKEINELRVSLEEEKNNILRVNLI